MEELSRVFIVSFSLHSYSAITGLRYFSTQYCRLKRNLRKLSHRGYQK